MQRQSIQSIMNHIYYLAKDQNIQELSRIQKEWGTLDIQLGGYTPATMLARDGEFKAVSFLYKNFFINMSNVAYGLGVGGHFDLLKLFNFDVQSVISGAARSSFTKEVFALIQQHHRHGHAIYEAAKSGNFPFVNELIRLLEKPLVAPSGSTTQSYFEDLIADAAEGAAEGGYFDEMRAYMQRQPESEQAIRWNDKTKVLNAAARGAARGSDLIVHELIEEGANLNAAVVGAVTGGHFEIAKDLLSRGNNINATIDACSSAIAMGYLEFAKELIEKSKNYEVLQFAFFSAAKSYHYEILNQLMKWKDLAENDETGYYSDYIRQRIPLYHSSTLPLISLIDEQRLQSSFIKEATPHGTGYSFEHGHAVDADYTKYLKATNVMNFLMKSDGLDFINACNQLSSMKLYSPNYFFPGCYEKKEDGTNYCYHDPEIDLLHNAIFVLGQDGRFSIRLNGNFTYEKWFAPNKQEAGTLEKKLTSLLNFYHLKLDNNSNFESELFFTKESSDLIITKRMATLINNKSIQAIFAKDLEKLQSFTWTLENNPSAAKVSNLSGTMFAGGDKKVNDGQIDVDNQQTTILSRSLLNGFTGF